MNTYELSDLLNRKIVCDCGKEHSSKVQHVVIEEKAIRRVPELMKAHGYQKAFIICDANTWEAAGQEVEETVKAAGLGAVSCVLESRELVPDEYAVGYLMMNFDPGCDLVIGVGTGVLNDTSKYFSKQLGREYFIVATAPSMDGFASTGAALISSNLKTTYEAHVPQAIIGPVEILAKAPMDMISAGLADIMGKYTCLIDWNMARIVNGEYYCEWLEKLVRSSIKKVMDNAPRVKDRDHTAIANIMEALVVTGIAMEFAGNSRPASGAEHHLSHYWEMQFLFEGRKAVLHGTKVGIGTIAITYAYNKLKDLVIDFAAAKANAENYDFDAWCEYMKKAYGVSADSVIKLEKKVQKNGTEGRLRRIHQVETHWSEIKELITNLIPTVTQMEETLESLGGAIRPSHVDIPREMFYNSVLTAKEVRDRYTILQMLWDLGLIEEFAKEMTDYMYA